MNVEIITPDKQLFQGEASSVTVPGSDGLLGILDHHAPLISSLKKGTVKLTSAGTQKEFEVNGGVVEVLNNKVMILAE
jgi:F-type H+-transporting ATPase subunit epsilon